MRLIGCVGRQTGNYGETHRQLVVAVLLLVHPTRTIPANGPACHGHGVTAQQVLTALFNVGIAISVGITVLSLGLSFTVRELVAPLHRVVLVIAMVVLNAGVIPARPCDHLRTGRLHPPPGSGRTDWPSSRNGPARAGARPSGDPRQRLAGRSQKAGP
jgi:hypothetical protein